jgi:hypothetical protein
MNTATSGSAVITKVLAGTNISISSTGADAGTGDVTISSALPSPLYVSGGNVGIGASSPAANLDINGGQASTNPVINISNTGSSTGGAGAFYGEKINVTPHNQATAAYGLYSYLSSAGYSIPEAAVYGEVLGSATAGQNAKGLWGKATQPSAGGYGMATGVYGEVTTGSTGTLSTTYAGYFNNSSTVGGTNYGLYVNAATGGSATIPLSVAVGGSEVVHVNSSGYVGIGTSSPQTLLDVNGTIRAGSYTYANLPSSPATGTLLNVSNANVNTFGASITGTGSYNVLARFNGSNWTVVGI